MTTPGVYGGVGYIGLNRAVRAAAGVDAGDRIRVAMELDTEPRTVQPPEDLRAALDAEPGRTRELRGALVHPSPGVRGMGRGRQTPGDASEAS